MSAKTSQQNTLTAFSPKITMRTIHVDAITECIAKLARQAAYTLPKTTLQALQQAQQQEVAPSCKTVLSQLIENAAIAGNGLVPLCQDTGMVIVFAEIGQDVHIVGGSFEAAVHKGVANSYTKHFLRKSMVAEPLFERINTTDNTPAIIHTQLVEGNTLTLLLAPKGGGSENKSALQMLLPNAGVEGVKNFMLETISAAGGSPCPPITVGVGIGGNLEMAALCAKKAACRDVSSSNHDERYAQLEKDWLTAVNTLGIGSMGLGGKITALKVNIEWYPTHITSLPVAVNINCHQTRHASAIL